MDLPTFAQKFSFLFLLAFLLAFTAAGQYARRTVTGMAGGTHRVVVNGKVYLVGSTVGQPGVIGSARAGGFAVRQGYQQPPAAPAAEKPDEETALQATVYPNPFTGEVAILFEEGVPTASQVEIYLFDMAGRQVFRQALATGPLLRFNAGELPAGSYLLKASAGKRVFSSTIIKQ